MYCACILYKDVEPFSCLSVAMLPRETFDLQAYTFQVHPLLDIRRPEIHFTLVKLSLFNNFLIENYIHYVFLHILIVYNVLILKKSPEKNSVWPPSAHPCLPSIKLSVSQIIFVFIYRSLSNGSYTLSINNSPNKYHVYCHMAEIPSCGPGGWTLVMKLDGNKVT